MLPHSTILSSTNPTLGFDGFRTRGAHYHGERKAGAGESAGAWNSAAVRSGN